MFSTAGRSEVLPANSVPEDPQRGLCKCVRACVCMHLCMLLPVCVCTCVCFSCICMSVAVYAPRLGVMFTAPLAEDNLIVSYILSLHISTIIKKHSYLLYAAIRTCPFN